MMSGKKASEKIGLIGSSLKTRPNVLNGAGGAVGDASS